VVADDLHNKLIFDLVDENNPRKNLFKSNKIPKFGVKTLQGVEDMTF
jgi:hypothetical protein